MLSVKHLTVISGVALLMGLQYYFGPKRVIVKTKEVLKIVEVIDRDIVIIEKDGVKTTKIKERQERQTDQTKQHSREVIPLNKDWLVGLSRSLRSDEYTGQVYRRVLFNLHVGGYATTKGEFGVGIIYQF